MDSNVLDVKGNASLSKGLLLQHCSRRVAALCCATVQAAHCADNPYYGASLLCRRATSLQCVLLLPRRDARMNKVWRASEVVGPRG
ncbi:hypothetical protein WJX81_003223 [Elliptochloris bilobata]|uniref:Uncharacterized protein n=1 Tax=Elliptochloris bilobata TaxID=381761 RepID=A0AAW1RY36_9CHLO